MPLDKVHAYQLVRVLRVVVPLLVVLLMAFLFQNYFDRVPDEPLDEEEAGNRLVEEMSDFIEELTYSQFEGERRLLDVQASTNLGFRDGRNLLQDVSVTVYGEEGEPDRKIQSDRCGVIRETGDMDCSGNVEIQLDPVTKGRTSAMRYDHATRTITSLDEAEIVRPGHFSVRADHMVVRMREDEFRLVGKVRVDTAEGIVFETERAWLYERGLRVEADGGVRLLSEKGDLRATRGEAHLDPDTFSLRRVRVWEGVSAQSFSPENPASLAANQLEIDVVSGEPEGLLASGEVTIGSGAGPDRRTLFGDSVDGSFDSGGKLETIEARNNATMSFGPGKLLESRAILVELPDLVTTFEDSVLDVGDFRVEGSHFRIEQGERVRFHTDRNALIRLPSGFTRGQHTEAEFDTDTNMLLGLVQTGEVEFEFDGRSGSAERMEVQEGGDRILLEGRPSVSTASVRIEATEIVLDQRDRSFEASGSVRTVSQERNPVLVRSDFAEGGEERVRFSGAAELWQGATHVSAARIDIDRQTNGFIADSDVASTIDDARIWSDRLEFDDQGGVVHYLGNVRVETEEMEMTSEDLVVTLVSDRPDRIVATGDVRLKGSNLDGRGDEAVYVRSTETLILTGEDAEVSDPETGMVRGRRFDIDFESNIVKVTSEGGERVVSRRAIERE